MGRRTGDSDRVSLGGSTSVRLDHAETATEPVQKMSGAIILFLIRFVLKGGHEYGIIKASKSGHEFY